MEKDRDYCEGERPVFGKESAFVRATWNDQRDLTPNEANFLVSLVRALDTPAPELLAVARCDDTLVQGCPDAAAALTRVDTLRPTRIDISACRQNIAHLCLSLEYEPDGDPNVTGQYTEMMVETDAATLFVEAPHILSVTFKRLMWVV